MNSEGRDCSVRARNPKTEVKSWWLSVHLVILQSKESNKLSLTLWFRLVRFFFLCYPCYMSRTDQSISLCGITFWKETNVFFLSLCLTLTLMLTDIKHEETESWLCFTLGNRSAEVEVRGEDFSVSSWKTNGDISKFLLTSVNNICWRENVSPP